ncbi:2-oxoadipate dioxygenase/decarboxylase family protein [Novosphingobium malaysiense]|uniref:2-oxoadipate dioxygenase/decarboxylase n=1 Tax=Novosphingobium malaysiense TaxID=1348853 RepID=A0A0B1ZNC9_9SPHN|nr:DUF1338 family protein [Novosphingobium malaysiense]KHK90771.1 IQ calmodulin-binding motif-containing protein [Novosphingobium malaysiense]
MASAAFPAADDKQTLSRLLTAVIGAEPAQDALSTLAIAPELLGESDRPNRAQVAMALNAALFMDLLERVPTAARYVEDVRKTGEPIVFDHGALRTIDGPCGDLPAGYTAFSRLLEPLGYEVGGLYPLPALRMTGRAFVHRDLPEMIPQFFVSELHVRELPEAAQGHAEKIFGDSQDPLGEAEWQALEALSRDGTCSMDEAGTIVTGALRAFNRQHPVPTLQDYRALLEHSKEGAWIATEGNAFNHATTRVADVVALAEDLKAQGFPMKPAVEISQNGRVRQTAILADKVRRAFRMPDGSETELDVPGSFYEFITRDTDPDSGLLDLTFDSGNATGIFAVTRDT